MTNKAIKIALVGMAVLPFTAAADGIEDYYHQVYQQRFFNQMQGARSVGMAGSSWVTSSDSNSVVGNPAGIGMMKDAEVSANYAYEQLSGNDYSNFQGIEQQSDNGSVLGTLPIGPYSDALPEYGNIGFGWLGDHRSSDDSADSDARAYKLALAYGTAVSDDLSLGYGIAYDHDKFNFGASEAKMTDGIKQTVGALYSLSKATKWGLSTSYGFGESKQNAGGFFNPSGGSTVKRDLSSWGIETGLSHMYDEGLTVAASTDYTNYDSDNDDAKAFGFKLGAEQALTDWLTGRVGYRYQLNHGFNTFDDHDQNAKFNAFSFGAGIPLGCNLNLDYGAEYRAVGSGDWSHVVSLVSPFTLCEN